MTKYEYKVHPIVSPEQLEIDLAALEDAGWHIGFPVQYTKFGTMQGAIVLRRLLETTTATAPTPDAHTFHHTDSTA